MKRLRAGRRAEREENFHQKIILVFSKNACERLSNPIRYLRFRDSVSGMCQSVAFAFGVPHDINGFHPYTMSSTDLSHPLALPFRMQHPC